MSGDGLQCFQAPSLIEVLFFAELVGNVSYLLYYYDFSMVTALLVCWPSKNSFICCYLLCGINPLQLSGYLGLVSVEGP